MPTSDLQISAKIRAILASHWIDAERLQFRTTRGTVRFYGVLARQGTFGLCEMGTSFVEILVDEIQSTPGVEKVYFTGVEIERHKRSTENGEEEVPASEEADQNEPREAEPVDLQPEAQLVE
jgi:hypothetical protein